MHTEVRVNHYSQEPYYEPAPNVYSDEGYEVEVSHVAPANAADGLKVSQKDIAHYRGVAHTSIAWALVFGFFSVFVAVGLYAVGWSKDPVRITSAEPRSIKMSLFANWIVTGLAIPAMVVLNEGASAIMQAYGVRSLLSNKKGLNFKLIPFVFTYLSKLGKITNFAVLIPTRNHQTAHVIGFVTLFAFGFRFFVSPVTVQTLPSVDVINVNRINSFELGFTATSIPIGVGLGLTMGFLEAGRFSLHRVKELYVAQPASFLNTSVAEGDYVAPVPVREQILIVTTGCAVAEDQPCPANQTTPLGSVKYGQFCVKQQFASMFRNVSGTTDANVACHLDINIATAMVNRTIITYPGGAGTQLAAVSDIGPPSIWNSPALQAIEAAWPAAITATGTEQLLNGLQASLNAAQVTKLDGPGFVRQLMAGALEGVFATQPRAPATMEIYRATVLDVFYRFANSGPILFLIMGIAHLATAVYFLILVRRCDWLVGYILFQQDVTVKTAALNPDGNQPSSLIPGTPTSIPANTEVRFKHERLGHDSYVVALRKAVPSSTASQRDTSWEKPDLDGAYFSA
ncbi:hypothetical protein HDU89_000894 [Geranomyces variabilis]|nr:hypothetical protein HDU89_000894 [Geranomyces variabilis]